MQPEISQRCSSCGAAIREPAMFCPECGKSLTPDSESPAATQTSQTEEQSAAMESPTEEESPETSSSPNPADEEAPAATAKDSLEPEPIAAAGEEDEAKPIIVKPAAEHPGKVERTREKLHRASNAARGALKENVKRVDNIRHASSAVIEEATYDPSLRFVLVALGLFAMALILLILSKVMG